MQSFSFKDSRKSYNQLFKRKLHKDAPENCLIESRSEPKEIFPKALQKTSLYIQPPNATGLSPALFYLSFQFESKLNFVSFVSPKHDFEQLLEYNYKGHQLAT